MNGRIWRSIGEEQQRSYEGKTESKDDSIQVLKLENKEKDQSLYDPGTFFRTFCTLCLPVCTKLCLILQAMSWKCFKVGPLNELQVTPAGVVVFSSQVEL